MVLILDLLVSARPCRLLHFYQPLGAVISYLSFSLVYWVAGGKNHQGEAFIYKYLDWGEFASQWPIFVAVILLVIPLYVFIWSLHLLRDWIHDLVTERHKVLEVTGYDNPAMQAEAVITP